MYVLRWISIIYIFSFCLSIDKGIAQNSKSHEKMNKNDNIKELRKEIGSLNDSLIWWKEKNKRTEELIKNKISLPTAAVQKEYIDVCKDISIGNQKWSSTNFEDSLLLRKLSFELSMNSDDWNRNCENKTPSYAYFDYRNGNHLVLNFWAMVQYKSIANQHGYAIPSTSEWREMEAFLRKVPKNESGENSANFIREDKEWSPYSKQKMVDLFGFKFPRTKYKADESDVWYNNSCIWLETNEAGFIAAGCMNDDTGKTFIIERRTDPTKVNYFGFPVRSIRK